MEKVQSKERAFKQLELLIKRFKNDLKKGVISGSHRKSSVISIVTEEGKKYSESQVRQGYILPMFRDVLGWNTDDSVNQVIPELHNHEGFADFTFVHSGEKKFLLETKKPYVNVDPNTQSGRDALRQAIGYSRSIKDIHLTLVSNFEVLVFSHTFTMPRKGEEMKNCLNWYHFTEFLSEEAFENLWEFRFEKAGTLEFGKTLLNKVDRKLTSQYKPVDKNLLNEIKGLRVSIANSLKPNTMSLLKREESVHLLINRIIFIRSLEDRGIVSQSIYNLLEKSNLWNKLGKLIDSIHYKFPISILNRRAGFPIDKKTVSIDDKALKAILRTFYDRGPKFFHDCYDFKYIPSDILGYAYEHSIAYELVADKNKGQFKLRKKKLYKNGIHYTPAYICTELSNASVERALTNLAKDAKELICFDIACGSGSFLTSVYDSIYKNIAKSSSKSLVEGNEIKVLNLSSRKSILENCIYGIDIDYFAVQTTKLCLYLKFFENFPKEDLNKKCSIPNLDKNIIFGDSLLDTSQDFRHPSKSLSIGAENKKIFRFIKNKSIDIIIGNPPYIKVQDLKKINNLQIDHYKKIYSKTLSKGSMEFAIGFIDRAMNLLKPKGVLGYIIPNKIFKNKQGENLRNFITNSQNNCNLYQFIDFNSCQIFDASIYTCLLYLEKRKPLETFKCCQVYDLKNPITTISEIRKSNNKYPSKYFEIENLKISNLSKKPWNLLIGSKRKLFNKLNSNFQPLSNVAIDKKIFQGIPTGSDKVYLMEKIKEKNSSIWIMKSEGYESIINYENKTFGTSERTSLFEIEKKYLKSVFKGNKGSKDLKLFQKKFSNTYLLYPYDNKGTLIKDSAFFKSKCYRFLNQNEIKNGYKGKNNKNILYGLNERERGRFKGKYFYQYSYPKNMTLWSKSKIMIPYLVNRFNAHLDNDGHVFVNVSTGGYCILAPTDKMERTHLLGVLNSTVFDFMIKCFSGNFRSGWMECNKHYIEKVPIPLSDKENINREKLIQVENCLKILYKNADAYYSKELTSSQLMRSNTFQRELEWLDSWSKDIYGLSDEEYQLIKFYTSDEVI